PTSTTRSSRSAWWYSPPGCGGRCPRSTGSPDRGTPSTSRSNGPSSPGRVDQMITPDELSSATAHSGENAIDTVVLAIVDMQGRLQGKRFDARNVVETVAAEGADRCNYVLVVDVVVNAVRR